MYFQSVMIPVKTGNKPEFLDMAAKMSSIFAEHGATRSVECWGDDLIDGKVTDFKKAVQATADETVVFSWDAWPDKAAYDAAMKKLVADDRMKPDGAMPFDGKRLIYGAFETSLDTGGGGRFGYLDGVIASVPDGSRQNPLPITVWLDLLQFVGPGIAGKASNDRLVCARCARA